MRGTISTVRAGGAGLVLGLSLILTGCAGDRVPMAAGQNFTPDQVDRFVIAKGDLPSEFKRVGSGTRTVPCDSGWLANRGALTETAEEVAIKEQLLALGPQSCHLSTYEHTMHDDAGAMLAVTGFQVFAVVFPGPNPASMALPIFRAHLADPLLYADSGEAPTETEDLDNPGLGDESVPGIKRLGPVSGGEEHTYIWRVRNVAVVLGGGGDMDEEDILKIPMNISERVVR